MNAPTAVFAKPIYHEHKPAVDMETEYGGFGEIGQFGLELECGFSIETEAHNGDTYDGGTEDWTEYDATLVYLTIENMHLTREGAKKMFGADISVAEEWAAETARDKAVA